MDLENVVKICDALSNPIRLKILYILDNKPMSIYELSKILNLSRPVLYAHIKKLEKANLIESNLIVENNRTKRIYKAKKFNFYIDNKVIEKLFKSE
ncbi:ArsR/SmtB family transcription factor [Methanocaldococcus indicus]|uniref:ArsR/SmtB family transcription factor n=1 Tax=Methanocaldococcus indicus TaxID=213231 RepID=UPI003C6CE204